jgi:hypothetical protein
MAGNVGEWCLNEYEKPENTDPGGDAPRVLRGGSWNYDPVLARASLRLRLNPVFRHNSCRLSCGVFVPHFTLSTVSLATEHRPTAPCMPPRSGGVEF